MRSCEYLNLVKPLLKYYSAALVCTPCTT